jgi:pyruvate dehydrogenase E2 component (dihydrolipoamide acetyltransferase)
VPMTGIRAVVAARLAESARTTVPVTLTTEVDATELVAWRRRLGDEGTRVSYNDLLLHLLGRALREHPRLNASLHGDAIRIGGPVHVGVAVDTDRGLLVPVVRDVDRKSLEELARETPALIEAARAGSLPPEAMRGGTFTLTNLGMFGIDAFTPVINLPECAILGVGRIKAVPAVVGEEICIRHRVWLSLTFDHRLVDGGPAARCLQRIGQLVEECPAR